jgi:hypothetical protein
MSYVDKNTMIRSFNAHFFDFLNDIISVIPESNTIIQAKHAFESIKRANPTILIKTWFSHVYSPYQEIIDKGDISFFYEKDYQEDLVGLKKSNEIMSIIDTLREPIKNMSEKNKGKTMIYISNLSRLSVLYSGVSV